MLPLDAACVGIAEPSMRAREHAELAMRHSARRPAAITGYYVSITGKKKTRRLHYAGACGRLPGVHYQEFEELGLD